VGAQIGEGRKPRFDGKKNCGIGKQGGKRKKANEDLDENEEGGREGRFLGEEKGGEHTFKRDSAMREKPLQKKTKRPKSSERGIAGERAPCTGQGKKNQATPNGFSKDERSALLSLRRESKGRGKIFAGEEKLGPLAWALDRGQKSLMKGEGTLQKGKAVESAPSLGPKTREERL